MKITARTLDDIDVWWPGYLKKVREVRRAEEAVYRLRLDPAVIRKILLDDADRKRQVLQAIEEGKREAIDRVLECMNRSNTLQQAAFKAMISVREVNQLAGSDPRLALAIERHVARKNQRKAETEIKTLYDGPDAFVVFRKRQNGSKVLIGLSVHRKDCKGHPQELPQPRFTYHFERVQCTRQQAVEMVAAAEKENPEATMGLACHVCGGVRRRRLPQKSIDDTKYRFRDQLVELIRNSGLAAEVLIDRGVILASVPVGEESVQVSIRMAAQRFYEE